uniref:Myb-like domain-containing protein n=1 Tax=Tetraselmis sp. GSL018 TaxID=582737 RepID=A0A061S8Q7_9CHLO|mmetsp:Transcript_34818/g.82603  ORF Transcript_34818/g.82603 Transcript_34818/m.82603 type:complete len:1045 (-) Transcript_34818:206-3340(-)
MVNKGLQPPQEILSKGQLCAETSAEVDTNTNNAAPGVGMKQEMENLNQANKLRHAHETADANGVSKQHKQADAAFARKPDLAKKSSLKPANPPRACAWMDSPRPFTHWDYVLMEMKWMATDFMQERRWRSAAAAHFAGMAAGSDKAFRGAVEDPVGQVAVSSSVTDAECPASAVKDLEGSGTQDAGSMEKPAPKSEQVKPEPVLAHDVSAAPNPGDAERADEQPSALGTSHLPSSDPLTSSGTTPAPNGDLPAVSPEGGTCGGSAMQEIAAIRDSQSKSAEACAEASAPDLPIASSSGRSEWCLTYHLKPAFAKVITDRLQDMDDRRALAHNLRLHEYQLEYEAACASVALAHQVAREAEAAQQDLALEKAALDGDDELGRSKRIKKKRPMLDMDLLDDEQNRKPAGLAAAKPPRTGSYLQGQRLSAAGAGASGVGTPPGSLPRHPSGFKQEGVATPELLQSAEASATKKTDRRRRRADSAAHNESFGSDVMDTDNAARGTKRLPDTEQKAFDRRNSKKIKNLRTTSVSDVHTDGNHNLRRTRRLASLGDTNEWQPEEDKLLCAIVHELGLNWALVTDVFSRATPHQGMHRKLDQCKSRYKTLVTSGPEGSLHAMVSQLWSEKGASREVLTKSMPIPDSVLHRRLSVLSQISLRLVTSIDEDRRNKADANQQRLVTHTSHNTVEMKCAQMHGNKLMSALELSDLVNQERLQSAVSAFPQQMLAPQGAGPPPAGMAPGPSGPAAAISGPPTHGRANPGSLGPGAAMTSQVMPGHHSVAPSVQGMGPGAATVGSPAVHSGAMTGISAGSQPLPPLQGQPPPGGQAGMPMAGNQMLPPASQNPAAFQAALQARQQQQVAQIAQQQQLTPQQQQQLLARLQAQQAMQASQGFSSCMAAPQGQVMGGMPHSSSSQQVMMHPQQNLQMPHHLGGGLQTSSPQVSGSPALGGGMQQPEHLGMQQPSQHMAGMQPPPQPMGMPPQYMQQQPPQQPQQPMMHASLPMGAGQGIVVHGQMAGQVGGVSSSPGIPPGALAMSSQAPNPQPGAAGQ